MAQLKSPLLIDVGKSNELHDLVHRWWTAMSQRWSLTKHRAEENNYRIEGQDFHYDGVTIKFLVDGSVRIFVHNVEANKGLAGLLFTPGFSWKHIDKMREDVSGFIESVWTKTTEEAEIRKAFLLKDGYREKFLADMAEWEVIR